MNYARVCVMSLLTLTIFSLSNDLRAQSASREYRYSYCDCAYELTDQIRIGSKKIGIAFDEHSNVEALKSFRSLKYGVWLGVLDQVYVVGTHDAGNCTFRLEHWYTVAPFTEYWVKDWNTVPQKVYKINRRNLRRSDFKRTDDFDPDSPNFNPSIYQRKGRGRVHQHSEGRARSERTTRLTP